MKSPQIPKTMSITVGNISDADAAFIRNVVSIFTDPQHEAHSRRLRDGQTAIAYRSGGALATYPLFDPVQAKKSSNPNPS